MREIKSGDIHTGHYQVSDLFWTLGCRSNGAYNLGPSHELNTPSVMMREGYPSIQYTI